jgi:hypothetical protein
MVPDQGNLADRHDTTAAEIAVQFAIAHEPGSLRAAQITK